MRGEAKVILVLAVLLAATPLVAAQTCRIQNGPQTVEYPCGWGSDDSDEGTTTTQSAWYQELDILLAVIGILGSIGAAAYTYYRVRSRRRTLVVTLAAVDRAYLDAKADPEAGIARLMELRAQIRQQHDQHKMDDAHFLELDRRAVQYLAKLRLLEVDRRFAHLPPLLLAEIRRLLSDGVLSEAEADLIEVRAAAYRVPEPARAELASLTRRWASEDGHATPGAVAPVA